MEPEATLQVDCEGNFRLVYLETTSTINYVREQTEKYRLANAQLQLKAEIMVSHLKTMAEYLKDLQHKVLLRRLQLLNTPNGADNLEKLNEYQGSQKRVAKKTIQLAALKRKCQQCGTSSFIQSLEPVHLPPGDQ